MPIKFRYVLGAGLLLGLVIGFKSFIPYLYWNEIEEYNWHRSALPQLINYLFWPFLVPLIYGVFQKFRFIKGATQKGRLITIAASFGIPFLHEAVTTFIYFIVLAVLDVHEFTEDTWMLVKGAFPSVYIGRIVEFWIIYGLFASIDYYKKYKDKQAELSIIEAQLNRTKLAVLKMQLQPHFLFNALNSISSLMEVDVKKAQQVTARLGDLLRSILDQDERVFVSLEEELEYVRTYLDIECVRFEDRLKVDYDIDPDMLKVKIPVFSIQPLVENSIKHGIAQRSGEGHIHIKAIAKGNNLMLSVADNGPGQSETIAKLFENGIGLKNLSDRLKRLFPGHSELNVITSKGNGFTVQITVPRQIPTP